jgi:hypothetical protein
MYYNLTGARGTLSLIRTVFALPEPESFEGGALG